MIKSLRQARITDGLPRVLARQEWVIALSEALGLALGKTLDYTDESQIYTRLDTAPEAVLVDVLPLLDVLARERRRACRYTKRSSMQPGQQPHV